MTALSAFTYQDLLDEIDEASRRATSRDIKQAWVGLREAVMDVSGGASTDDFDPSNGSGLWWLLSIEVAGFRGVPPTGLVFELDPTPGITVIHGPNGSGKSSICDGVDVGLHQTANASIERLEGRGGNLPVWEPVLVNSEGSTGILTLQLKHDDGRLLRIKTEVSDGSAFALASEILHPGEGIKPVPLGHAWRSAVDAHAPTYAYASWEQHIHRSQDLQKYLERMLVLGGCFSAVEQAIEHKAQEAHDAAKRVKAVTSANPHRLADLSAAWGREVALDPPGLDDDIDAWWQASGLPSPAATADSRPAELSIDQLLTSIEEARASLDQLIEPGKNSGLAAALNSLDEIADELDPDTCPVCASRTVWRDHLHSAVESRQAALKSIKSWGGHLNSVLVQAAAVLPKLLEGSSPDEQSELSLAAIEHQRLETAKTLKGVASPATAAAAEAFFSRVTRDRFQAEALAAIERSSAEAAWLAALASAFTPLADALRADGQLARESKQWTGIAGRLNDLRKRLRDRREAELRSATDNAVAALLGDAGLSVEGLSIQTRQADIKLKDLSGRTIELGMLSAGQRNAVLLAPALAMAEGGPFGFMIVDDPVHSFDEMRVDFVARQLARIAAQRRVVVLTHDERLKEHLLAAALDSDSRSIRRDATTGQIELTRNNTMWQVLLEDTQRLLALAEPPQYRLGLTNTLRGLCRQAFDNALRLFITSEAVNSGADAKTWLASLDAAGVATTAQRLDAASALLTDVEAKTRLEHCRTLLTSQTLLEWNMAAHGNPALSKFTDDEITTARAACKALFK